MTTARVSTLTNTGLTTTLYVFDCPRCGVIFGIPADYDNRRREDHRSIYCPSGHTMTYDGPTAEQKLKKAEAREQHLTDQLSAAIRDGEETRVALLRDRQRFANGVCPCCNRSFDNVRRHMSSKHPNYDATDVKRPAAKRSTCSCGSAFDTLTGLRIHQGRLRGPTWDAANASRWSAHLTVTT